MCCWQAVVPGAALWRQHTDCSTGKDPLTHRHTELAGAVLTYIHTDTHAHHPPRAHSHTTNTGTALRGATAGPRACCCQQQGSIKRDVRSNTCASPREKETQETQGTSDRMQCAHAPRREKERGRERERVQAAAGAADSLATSSSAPMGSPQHDSSTSPSAPQGTEGPARSHASTHSAGQLGSSGRQSQASLSCHVL